MSVNSESVTWLAAVLHLGYDRDPRNGLKRGNNG